MAPGQGGRPAGPSRGNTVESRAEAARAAGRLDEAAALYRQALAARPRWAEGLWALGTIAYEQDRFAECRDVFSRLVAVQPKMAAAWALRGLCEFRLGSHMQARGHLDRAVALGLPAAGGAGPRRAVYHQALLLVRDGASSTSPSSRCATILQFQPPSPELELACGLVLLRRPLLPRGHPRGATATSSARPGRRTARTSRATPSRPCRGSRRW